MPKRIVKNALVRYEDNGRKYAFRGQEIDVPQKVIDKLGDQLYPQGKGPADDPATTDVPGPTAPAPDAGAGDGAPPLDLDTAAVEDAAAWLNGDNGKKPKASEIVAAANGDVDRAQLLLEAEQSLKGDARKTVVEPLRKIIDEGGSS